MTNLNKNSMWVRDHFVTEVNRNKIELELRLELHLDILRYLIWSSADAISHTVKNSAIGMTQIIS